MQLREGEAKEIKALKNRSKSDNSQQLSKQRSSCRNRPAHGMSSHSKPIQQKPQLKDGNCSRCGKKHPPGKESCPAKTSKCFKCGKTGHFQRMCKSVNTIETRTRGAHLEESQDRKFLGAIGRNGENKEKPWTATLQINSRPIVFKIDTGDDTTVIPTEIPTEIYDCEIDGELLRPSTTLLGPDQNQLEVRGCFKTKVLRGDKCSVETIDVVDRLRSAVVGRPTIKSLYLLPNIARVEKSIELKIVTRFPELFTGIGCIRGSYQIKLENNAKPYSISAPRRAPIHLLPKVKQELRKMEKQGVISRINESTDGCSGMVVPKSDGRVRICVDLLKLNCHVR